jgi:hypothetical protein
MMSERMAEEVDANDVTLSFGDGNLEDVEARVISLDSDGIVRVKVPRELSEGKRLQVRTGPTCSTAATVLYSVGEDTEHWATIKVHPENRRDSRIPVNASGRLIVTHSNPAIATDALITDVSKSGLGLQIDHVIPVPELVKIVLDCGIVFGETRHCRQVCESTGKHQVGIEIETVILRGEADPDWEHTPRVLWGSLARAASLFYGDYW